MLHLAQVSRLVLFCYLCINSFTPSFPNQAIQFVLSYSQLHYCTSNTKAHIQISCNWIPMKIISSLIKHDNHLAQVSRPVLFCYLCINSPSGAGLPTCALLLLMHKFFYSIISKSSNPVCFVIYSNTMG